ncbi:MAG: PaaX family transcriptional regulator [Pararhodobacter sp.]|nr:PaaX family transcriptional regulator [Pararhodobacter sp.]
MPANWQNRSQLSETDGGQSVALRAESGTGQGSVERLLADMPLRAGGFIVTLYGDVVGARGGEIWIGNIIEACAAVGISETLVRTAVSRLVAAGRLEGRRTGRRSFYRLSEAARAEFDEASRAIYGPDSPAGWRFVFVPEALGDGTMAQLERAGFARLKPQLAVGPDRIAVPDGALTFAAKPETGLENLSEFAATAWDLGAHARAYRGFIDRFSGLERAPLPPGPTALTLRLLLVHVYRQARLRDPRLPPEALPANWPGHGARKLFARVYLALSVAADSHVGSGFEAVGGALAATTPTTEMRLTLLARTAQG